MLISDLSLLLACFPVDLQMSKISAHFCLTHFIRMALVWKEDAFTDPADASLFGSETVMVNLNGRPQLVKEFGPFPFN
jgi:hypothetical protein